MIRNRPVVSIDRNLIAGGALLVIFFISLLLYLFRPSPTVQRVLFFPDETTGMLSGEIREIPRQTGREAEISYLLRELVLGPTSLRFGRILPRKTRIESVLLRDGVLYVGLSEDLVFPTEEMLVDYEQMIAGVRKSIEYNYPRVEKISFFIDGVQARSDERNTSC